MKQHIAIFGEFDITCTRNKPVQKTVIINFVWQESSKTWRLPLHSHEYRELGLENFHHPERCHSKYPICSPQDPFSPDGLLGRFHSKWAIYKDWVQWVSYDSEGWVQKSTWKSTSHTLWISCRFILVKCYHSFTQCTFFLHPSHLLEHQILSFYNLKASSNCSLLSISSHHHLQCGLYSIHIYIWIWSYPPFIFL